MPSERIEPLNYWPADALRIPSEAPSEPVERFHLSSVVGIPRNAQKGAQ